MRTTGGDVVPYFRFEGYVDRVDRAAWILLAGSLGLIALNFLWGFVSTRPARPAPAPHAPKAGRPPSAPRGNDPVSRAARSVDATVDFKEQAKEAARRELDKGDAREDDMPD